MGVDQTAVFAVASEILHTHGGSREESWNVAMDLVAEFDLREIFVSEIGKAGDRFLQPPVFA